MRSRFSRFLRPAKYLVGVSFAIRASHKNRRTSKLGGRPRINLQKTLRYLCEALRLDATVEEACSYAEISERTFYHYNKNDEGFSQEIRRGLDQK